MNKIYLSLIQSNTWKEMLILLIIIQLFLFFISTEIICTLKFICFVIIDEFPFYILTSIFYY